jgi:magnesium transporter
VDEHGGITRRYISSEKTERLTTLYGLVPRDIRKLAASTHSHIRIRPSTVLLHIFHLKVLVQRDRILLFDDATNVASRAAFLRELRERILQGDTVQQERYSQQRLTFEFRALEAVLSVVVSELEAELETVRRSAERVLRCLEDDVDRRTLITLLSLSNKVVQFARQAELVRSALDNVLDRDERVAALYLTAKGTRDGRAKSVDDDLTVAERLLGSYYIAYNEIVQDAQNLVSGLRNTQERSDFYRPPRSFPFSLSV